MKKNLSLLMLLLVLMSCSKEIQQVDSALSAKKNAISLAEAYQKSSSLMTTQGLTTKEYNIPIISVPSECFNSLDIPGYKLIRTHGSVGVSSITLGMSTYNKGEKTTGSGFALKFPFKYGKSYAIKISVIQRALEVPGDVAESLTRRPSLQAQFANDVVAASEPCGDASPVSLSGSFAQTIELSSSNNSYSNKTFTINPDKCYDYLQFSALPNTNGWSAGSVSISDLTITEQSILEIDGPDLTCIASEGDFSPKAFGLSISDIFDWSVTGDLQIVGNANGNTVRIKSLGYNGGQIFISKGSCTMLATKNFASQNVTFKPYRICNNNTPFALSANPIDGVLSRRWVAKTDQGDITLSETGAWKVQVPVHTLWVDLFVTTVCGETRYRERVLITNCGI